MPKDFKRFPAIDKSTTGNSYDIVKTPVIAQKFMVLGLHHEYNVEIQGNSHKVANKIS